MFKLLLCVLAGLGVFYLSAIGAAHLPKESFLGEVIALVGVVSCFLSVLFGISLLEE